MVNTNNPPVLGTVGPGTSRQTQVSEPPVLGTVGPGTPRQPQTPQPPVLGTVGPGTPRPAEAPAAALTQTAPHKRHTGLIIGGVLLAVAAAVVLLHSNSIKSLFSTAANSATKPLPFKQDQTVIVTKEGAVFSYCTVDKKEISRPLKKGEAIFVKSINLNNVGGVDSDGTFGTFHAGDVIPAPTGTPQPPKVSKTGHCSPNVSPKHK